jgi:hypothetical protein
VFGEGFGIDKPFDDAQARRIDGYMRDNSVRDDNTANPLLPGMINFPLYGTLGDVFARGRPTAELAYRIRNMMQVHAKPAPDADLRRQPRRRPLPRRRQRGRTAPGVAGDHDAARHPTIYYGTEQGFAGQRDSMFRRRGPAPVARQRISTMARRNNLFLKRANRATPRASAVFSRHTDGTGRQRATPGALV